MHKDTVLGKPINSWKRGQYSKKVRIHIENITSDSTICPYCAYSSTDSFSGDGYFLLCLEDIIHAKLCNASHDIFDDFQKFSVVAGIFFNHICFGAIYNLRIFLFLPSGFVAYKLVGCYLHIIGASSAQLGPAYGGYKLKVVRNIEIFKIIAEVFIN